MLHRQDGPTPDYSGTVLHAGVARGVMGENTGEARLIMNGGDVLAMTDGTPAPRPIQPALTYNLLQSALLKLKPSAVRGEAGLRLQRWRMAQNQARSRFAKLHLKNEAIAIWLSLSPALRNWLVPQSQQRDEISQFCKPASRTRYGGRYAFVQPPHLRRLNVNQYDVLKQETAARFTPTPVRQPDPTRQRVSAFPQRRRLLVLAFAA